VLNQLFSKEINIDDELRGGRRDATNVIKFLLYRRLAADPFYNR
jgi:hypothetical protein